MSAEGFTLVLLAIISFLILYISAAFLKGVGKFKLPGTTGEATERGLSGKGISITVLSVIVVAILMLNIGWRTASPPPEPELIIREPFLQKLTVETDRFACIPFPKRGSERFAFRIEEDVEELTLIEWHFEDGHTENGIDRPGGRENDQNTFPTGFLDRACYRSIEPEGNGYVIERIEWFVCDEDPDSTVPSCFEGG